MWDLSKFENEKILMGEIKWKEGKEIWRPKIAGRKIILINTLSSKIKYSGWRGRGKGILHYWWQCKFGAATMENSMEVP